MPKEKNAKAAEQLGSPEKLIAQLLNDPSQKDWAVEKITHGGPPHKQLQHTLVLNRLEKLAKLLSKRNGLALTHTDGKDIESEEELLPVKIPASSLAKAGRADKLMKDLTKGPQHEILYTALLLQTIEAMISAEEKVK